MTTPTLAAPRGDPSTLALGPGYLYVSPLGSTEPFDLTTPWEDVDPGWILLGYTETGSEFNYALATGEVSVAEELDPVFVTTTGRTSSVTINMAQITASHLALAMNGGSFAITVGGDPAYPNSPASVVIVEPPNLGSEQRVMIGWEAEDHTERWIYRQCFQTGTAKLARAKGNTPTTIATTFSLEKPSTGLKLFAAIMNIDPDAFGIPGGAAVRGGWMVPDYTPGGPPPVPTVTGVAPNNGPSTGGTTVTITGTGLAGVTGAQFGTSAATSITPGTATAFDAVTPAGTASTDVDVTATTPGGTSAPLTDGFSYGT
jgi:hypothetical protein